MKVQNKNFEAITLPNKFSQIKNRSLHRAEKEIRHQSVLNFCKEKKQQKCLSAPQTVAFLLAVLEKAPAEDTKILNKITLALKRLSPEKQAHLFASAVLHNSDQALTLSRLLYELGSKELILAEIQKILSLNMLNKKLSQEQIARMFSGLEIDSQKIFLNAAAISSVNKALVCYFAYLEDLQNGKNTFLKNIKSLRLPSQLAPADLINTIFTYLNLLDAKHLENFLNEFQLTMPQTLHFILREGIIAKNKTLSTLLEEKSKAFPVDSIVQLLEYFQADNLRGLPNRLISCLLKNDQTKLRETLVKLPKLSLIFTYRSVGKKLLTALDRETLTEITLKFVN